MKTGKSVIILEFQKEMGKLTYWKTDHFSWLGGCGGRVRKRLIRF